MIYLRLKYSFFIISILSAYFFDGLHAQQSSKTIVKGIITDSKTGEPLPFVTVFFAGKKQSTTSNADGDFILTSADTTSAIQFSYLGYLPCYIKIKPGQNQNIEVKLKPDIKTLNEVVITPGKKKKYRNKNNPAVELIGNVIDHRKINESKKYDYIEYEKYEKNLFALSNLDENFKKKKIFKKFQFVFKNVDTTKIQGKEVLPIYIKESLSDYYFRRPNDHKEIVKANKMVSFEGYVDNQGVTAYLKYFYQDINIYDDNIIFVSNQFLSPIAFEAPVFYKYFILDTGIIDNKKCVHVAFVPRNKTDLLFQGELYILLDSTYAVKKVDMYVNRDINLNWVQNVKIKQDYENIDGKGYILTNDEMDLDFGITQDGLGVYGERVVSYKNIKINKPEPDSTYEGLPSIYAKDADIQPDKYWQEHRHNPLSTTEAGTYKVVDSVKHIPAFKNTLDIIVLVWGGYLETKYFEFGPVGTFYSYNPIEGSRFRFGGRTTPMLSKKISFDTYAAYGATDRRMKYFLSTTYSLTNRTIYQFPVKSIRLSYQNETKIPGQELEQIQDDNIFLTLKRGLNDKMFYSQTFKIEHFNEFENHFSYRIGCQFLRESPAGNLHFTSNGRDTSHIDISEPYIALRYAPNEQFYQGKQFRSNAGNGYPIFQLQCNIGSKALKNFYNYQNVRFTVSKRFYFSIFGYSDVIWESGKIFGRVPFPLLDIHRANQSYSYEVSSYNLMNFLEFVSDEYTALNIDHNFYGFFFNKVPLFRRLKLREVVSCKILYGNLSATNDPAKHPDLFQFPANATFPFKGKPYVEGSVGVANILKLFRVDLVERFTYLNHPNVTSWGIRARINFDF